MHFNIQERILKWKFVHSIVTLCDIMRRILIKSNFCVFKVSFLETNQAFANNAQKSCRKSFQLKYITIANEHSALQHTPTNGDWEQNKKKSQNLFWKNCFFLLHKKKEIVKLHSVWSLNKWWLLVHTLQKIHFIYQNEGNEWEKRKKTT